jgi:hypothetical protein
MAYSDLSTLGNIAVGNTSAFLPVVVQGVAQAKTPAGRLLYLHALKEVGFIYGMLHTDVD